MAMPIGSHWLLSWHCWQKLSIAAEPQPRLDGEEELEMACVAHRHELVRN